MKIRELCYALIVGLMGFTLTYAGNADGGSLSDMAAALCEAPDSNNKCDDTEACKKHFSGNSGVCKYVKADKACTCVQKGTMADYSEVEEAIAQTFQF